MGPATSSIRKIHLDPLFPVHPLLGHSLLKLSHFLFHHMLGVELSLAYTQQSRREDTLINIHNIKMIKDQKNQAIKV